MVHSSQLPGALGRDAYEKPFYSTYACMGRMVTKPLIAVTHDACKFAIVQL